MSLQQLRQERRTKSGAQALGALDRLSALSYRLLAKPALRLSRSFPHLQEDILKSNLRITPQGLLSLALFVALLVGAIAAAVTALGIILGLPVLALSLVAVPPSFMLVLLAPKLSQASRAYAIENELAYVMGFLVVLAGGGVSPVAALRRIARMDRVFPAASKEAKRILVDTDVLGLDPLTALERAARYSPSRIFSEVLYGYTTVLRTGGDYVTYLVNKQREIFEARGSKVKRASEVVGIFAEAYLSLSSLLGMTLFVLFEVQAVLTHSAQGISSLLLFSVVIIPLFSALFIWLLDQIHIKQPYVDTRPYRGLIASLPLGILLLLLPMPMYMYLRVALALILLSLPPALLAARYERERESMEKALPDFIKDLAEARRVGLAPEAGIARASKRGYGALSKYVKKMGAQISWGLPLSKVLNTFVSAVHSWMVKAAGTLILETIDVGGGTVRSFSDMADFTRKMNDLERDKRASLKPYLFVMYMAGLMTIITALLMVYMLANSVSGELAALASLPKVSPQTVDIFLAAATLDGWLAGLVAGKMSGGTLADGFKHGLALSALSLVVILIASRLLGIALA